MKRRGDPFCRHCGIRGPAVEEITLAGGGRAALCRRCVGRYDHALRHEDAHWLVRQLDRRFPPKAA